MGLTLNEVKILALRTSGATRAALEAIAGEKPKQNKYHVAPREARTVDGIVFASKREAWRYRELVIQSALGLISDLKLQPTFELEPACAVNGGLDKIRAINYVADFQYTRNGETIVEDVKGVETPVFKIKAKMFRAKYPNLTLEVSK